MSPLLYAIAIETLSEAIRNNLQITDVTKSYDHKVSLHADDIVTYITNLINMLPTLQLTIQRFSEITVDIYKSIKIELIPSSLKILY